MDSSPRSPSLFPCSARTSISTKSTTAALGTILGSSSALACSSKGGFSGLGGLGKRDRVATMRVHESLAIGVPDILLPKPGTDLARWAVIACDQFTSQPEYWHAVERIVGDAPSTLNLTFPEVYLEDPDGEARIRNIQASMHRYMDDGILQPQDG